MTKTTTKRGRGRATDCKPEYAAQAAKLSALGATDMEIGDFFAMMPSEDDWLYVCLLVIRQDRSGTLAARKASRAKRLRQYMRGNPPQRVRKAVASRMWATLKGKRDGALFSRLGYTLEELVEHLERQFQVGMSWDNYGAWHIDHKRPCASFDLTDPSEFAACWALDNLAPLWADDNIKKGATYASA